MTAIGVDIGGTSVKVAAIDDALRPISHASSQPYTERTPREIAERISAALDQLRIDRSSISRVGVCVPGRRDATGRLVTQSTNLPKLVGTDIVRTVQSCIGMEIAPTIVTDAYAAAHDAVQTLNIQGRVLAISMGTGVGACVLDDGVPLRISGESSGHLGQIDVGRVDTHDRVGPDGGMNTLEAHVGLAALRARFADDLHAGLADLTAEDPVVRALVRAVRIAHAIYRPNEIILLGGIGIALRPHASMLDAACRDGLSTIARPDWRLHFGQHGHHAAFGCARLSAER